jgi:pilus assembly protein CpaE
VIRVLIADQVARIVGDLEKLAPYAETIDVCGVAHQPSSVLEEAWLRQPDVLILDETFATPGLADFSAQLASVSPATRVVLMTASEGPVVDSSMARMVRRADGAAVLHEAIVASAGTTAGVDDASASATHDAWPGRRAPHGRATVIVVFSSKGGTGTSMVASNLAVALAGGTEGRVALIDTDLQSGDAATMLHVESHLLSIADLAAHGEVIDAELLEEVLATGPAEVRVLRSASSPELAETVTASVLRSIIREMSRALAFVVVDTPSHLDERTLEAFDLADRILLLSSYNMTSVRGTRESLRMLDALGVSGDRVDVILNHTRPRVSYRREDVEAMLGRPAVADLPHDPRVDQSVDGGTPIVISEPRSELSRRIANLASRMPAPAGERGASPVDLPTAPPAPVYRRRFSLGRR